MCIYIYIYIYIYIKYKYIYLLNIAQKPSKNQIKLVF